MIKEQLGWKHEGHRLENARISGTHVVLIWLSLNVVDYIS